MRPRDPVVAAVTQAVGVDSFGDGGLAAGADRIVPLPRLGVLLAPDPSLDLLQALGQEGDVASSTVGVPGAGEPVFAGPAGGLGEQHGQPFMLVAQGGLPRVAGDVAEASQRAGLPVGDEVGLREAGMVLGPGGRHGPVQSG